MLEFAQVLRMCSSFSILAVWTPPRTFGKCARNVTVLTYSLRFFFLSFRFLTPTSVLCNKLRKTVDFKQFADKCLCTFAGFFYARRAMFIVATGYQSPLWLCCYNAKKTYNVCNILQWRVKLQSCILLQNISRLEQATFQSRLNSVTDGFCVAWWV